MKVATATPNMIGLFGEYYPNIVPISHRPEENDLDLLIFTGGEDLNPGLYSENPRGAMGWNDRRDDIELRIFNRWVSGDLRTKRVLGVCRGLQFLNVALGGTLIQDMDHPGIHKAIWDKHSPFKYLEYVNSLHHQAINRLGDMCPATIIATEPTTGLIEAVLWASDVFAVQFHPEMFGAAEKRKFFSIIDEWIRGNLSLTKKSDNRALSYHPVAFPVAEEDNGLRVVARRLRFNLPIAVDEPVNFIENEDREDDDFEEEEE